MDKEKSEKSKLIDLQPVFRADRQLKNPSLDTAGGYCFFDAGEIDISLLSAGGGYCFCYSKDGTNIFWIGLSPLYVYSFFEATSCSATDYSFFSPSLSRRHTLYCFDPRITMLSVLVGWVQMMERETGVKIDNAKKIEEALKPIPTYEEARTFLKKNNILREKPIWGPKSPASPSILGLKDVPDKVRKLFIK